MEFIHAAKFLQEWFDGLPANVRAWLIQAYWILVPAVALLVLYAVVRKESITESGRVTVKWFRPSQWLARFRQIEAENQAKLPENMQHFLAGTRRFLAFSHRAADLVYGVMATLLGFLGVLFSLILNPFKAWWLFLPSALLLYFAYRIFRKAPDS
jgi:hypothetical protein